MKKFFVFFSAIITITFVGCQRYEFVGPNEGQNVFLDNFSGKVIYINNSNRVVDYIDLKISQEEINRIRIDKERNDSAQKMKIWETQDIPGTKYSLELATRFYDDKLLYTLEMSPYDDGMRRLANTITLNLVDMAGFTLETIIPETWRRSVDAEGKPQGLTVDGSLPITLENYFEINGWSPLWSNP